MKLTDPDVTVMEAVALLSEGNPGAFTVLAQLVMHAPAALILLDQQEIYGPDIWLAYKDVSSEDLAALVDNLFDPRLKEKLAALK